MRNLYSYCNRKLFQVLACLAVMTFVLSTASAQRPELHFFSTPPPAFTAADTGEVQSLIRKAIACRYRDIDSAILYLEAAKNKSLRCGYMTGVAQALLGLGNSYSEQGKYERALAYFYSAKAYLGKAEYFRDRFSTLWYQNIAIPYAQLGNYDSAVHFLQEGLQYAARLKDTASLVIFHTNIAATWISNGQPEKALSYLKNIENTAERTDDKNLAQLYNNLSSVYSSLGDTALVKAYALKALAAGKRKNNKKDQRFALTHLANYYLRSGDHPSAIKTYQQELALCDSGSAYTFIAPHYGLSKVYFNLEDFPKAKQHGLKANSYVEQTNLRGQMTRSIYGLLAEVYDQLDRPDSAFVWQRAYAQLSDSLNDVARNRALDELEVKYQSERKDKALMENQLLIARQQNRIKNQQLWLLGGLALLVTATLIFLLSYRSLRHKRLMEKKSEEIRLLKASMDGEEKERSRLARELHDGIASQLMAARMGLHSLQESDRDIRPEELKVMYNQVREAGEDLRKAAHNLIPDALKEKGLAAAIATLCGKIENSVNLEVTFERFREIPRFSADIELMIYRIVQELIQNVLKHAAAKSLLVQLSYYAGVLQLTVEDDGKGMRVAGPEGDGGAGLNNIRERLQLLEGEMSIESSPGKGTAVHIECNINPNKNNSDANSRHDS